MVSAMALSLSARIDWLIEVGRPARALDELSECVREEGNDGAHAGTLTKDDAEDLADFTFALLERLYTEPRKLELARKRRERRRTRAEA